MTKTSTITFRLDSQFKQFIEAVALEEGKDISSVIRDALERMSKARQRKQKRQHG